MADDAKGLQRRLERAAKLLDAIRELQAKTYEVTEELQALLKGEAITGDHLRLLEAAWSIEYERRYGTPYMFEFKRDRPLWKRLVKAVGPDEVHNRIVAYFHETDQYRERARHPFGLFVSQFNSLATLQRPSRPGEDLLGFELMARDCHHKPPCTSDAQHTRRKAEDVRRGQA